jgi:sporulation protein YlmC with PRC-barrel domain
MEDVMSISSTWLRGAMGTTAILALSSSLALGQQTQQDPAATDPAVQQPPAQAAPDQQPVIEQPAEQRGPVGYAPVDGFIAAQDPAHLMANDLLGASVVDAQGESLGSIDDFIVDPFGGIGGVVVSVGGFLGIGAKDVAVPWEALQYQPQERTAYLDVTREQLETAPDFQTVEDMNGAVQLQQPAATDPQAGTTTAPATGTTQ